MLIELLQELEYPCTLSGSLLEIDLKFETK